MTFSEAGKLGALASLKITAELKQQRIDKYNVEPNLCKFCLIPLAYDKRNNNYCNHNCAAKQLNTTRGYTLSENKIFNCLFCGNDFKAKGTEDHKYCSRECMSSFWWQESKNKILQDGYDTSYNHKLSKKLLVESNKGKCQSCQLSEWCNKPMPLVLDHINGNSEDGSLTNLRVICNNCDALTDTYKAKNKGNGRAVRRQRYKDGKSY